MGFAHCFYDSIALILPSNSARVINFIRQEVGKQLGTLRRFF